MGRLYDAKKSSNKNSSRLSKKSMTQVHNRLFRGINKEARFCAESTLSNKRLTNMTTDNTTHIHSVGIADESSIEEFFRQLLGMAGDRQSATPATEPALVTTENCKAFEYVPDEVDMEMLAWAYLDEGIELQVHNFTLGETEKSWHRFQRFELIVKHLGESRRREMIDDMDVYQARRRGDFWQVFKASCKPGFWSTPADRAAIVREAKLHPEQLSDYETAHYGRDYLEILRNARKGIFTNNGEIENMDTDDESEATT